MRSYWLTGYLSTYHQFIFDLVNIFVILVLYNAENHANLACSIISLECFVCPNSFS